MDLIYNELSNTPLNDNNFLASEKLVQFIFTYKKAKENGFERIRFSKLLYILKIEDNTNIFLRVEIKNIFSVECFEQNLIKTSIENMNDVELIESILEPSEKKIHFKDDHGKDVLQRFANRLIKSPYVEE